MAREGRMGTRRMVDTGPAGRSRSGRGPSAGPTKIAPGSRERSVQGGGAAAEAAEAARSSSATPVSGGRATDSLTAETSGGASPVINRTARRKLTYEYAQLTNTTRRFRKPIKKKR